MNKNIDNYLRISREFTQSIPDCVWGTIAYPPNFDPILRSRAFCRLRKIRQLGPTYIVYPSATHTRYAHSLGVMHVAASLLKSLLLKPKTPILTYSECLAFIVAALLHDLGHFPYTHSLKNLPLPSHEELSGIIITRDLAALLHAIDIDPDFCAAIINQSLANPKPSQYRTSLPLFRNLLSGPVDPDKLDYLSRDAYFTGISTTPIALEELVHSIKVDDDTQIALTSQLIVEKVQFVKYLLYSQVYWHAKVRSITAMIKHALYIGLENHYIDSDQLIALDDESLLELVYQNYAYKDVTTDSIPTTAKPKPLDSTAKQDMHGLLIRASNGDAYECIGEWEYDARLAPLYNLETRYLVEQQLLYLISAQLASLSNLKLSNLRPPNLQLPDPQLATSQEPSSQEPSSQEPSSQEPTPRESSSQESGSQIPNTKKSSPKYISPLILDLPENISFEASSIQQTQRTRQLSTESELRPLHMSQRKSIFSDTLVNNFTRHITRLRLFAAPQIAKAAIKVPDISEIYTLISSH